MGGERGRETEAESQQEERVSGRERERDVQPSGVGLERERGFN